MKEIYLPHIIKLRKKRWTYQEIGEELHISKQRVHQLYKNYTTIREGKENIKKALGGCCEICGNTEFLEIHHKKGRSNNINNLQLFCRKHHREEEQRLYREGIKDKDNFLKRGSYKLCEICLAKKIWVVPCLKITKRFCSPSCRNKGTGARRFKKTKHGTDTMYAYHKCKCERCKEAHT